MKLKLNHIYFDLHEKKLFKVIDIDKDKDIPWPMITITQDGISDCWKETITKHKLIHLGFGEFTDYPEYFL